MIKLLYKPVDLVASMVGGLILKTVRQQSGSGGEAWAG